MTAASQYMHCAFDVAAWFGPGARHVHVQDNGKAQVPPPRPTIRFFDHTGCVTVSTRLRSALQLQMGQRQTAKWQLGPSPTAHLDLL